MGSRFFAYNTEVIEKKEGMKKEDIDILKTASAILDEECSRGGYCGKEASVFFEAVRWIEKSIKKVHKE